ncbi:DUF5063 domain-containing protein [Timonella senegalensis]|uniref:DUF5063 domain-containing protein n=1 Tax=Timonella senegalensis TaxID=1465825 RepID=UPI0003035011|nr:DUF5063 domain-containing protein [Timonella senegalensis]
MDKDHAVVDDTETPLISIEALGELSKLVVPRVRGFIQTVVDVATAGDPEASISLLVLALSDVLNAGAHLGATTDIIPPKRFEPDLGDDLDLDPLREALSRLFEGLDTYPEVIDPVVGPELGAAEISSDFASIIESLTHGLHHYDSGHEIEALWWWQYSYIASWGERASAVLRVLQLILMHLRLDIPDDVAQAATFDALFGDEN